MRLLFVVGLASLVACKPFEGQSPRAARAFEAADIDPTSLRFMHWNINTVGAPGETEYEAMLDVVGRLQPDVLALNEIEDDEDTQFTYMLAEAAGYDYVVSGDHVRFGNDRNAILSRYPITPYGAYLSDDVGEEDHMGWTSAALSGDDGAVDITRAFVAATVHAPGGDIGILSLHWKSGGSGNRTEFRRAVESIRTLQALDEFGEVDHLLVSGDLNVDVHDNVPTPTEFWAQPTGFPARWSLGNDMVEMMETTGIPNNPHQVLSDYGLQRHEAFQVDGFNATRPESGRVIDYVYTNNMVARDAEIYNSIFDDDTSGITKAGEPLDALACAQTSDHLPVIVDFALDGQEGPTFLSVADLVEGDLLITELMANPVNCSDSVGEWIEIYNASGFPVRLEGLEVQDASGNSGALGEMTLANGERAVLARNAAACDVDVDGVYGNDTSLNNSGDDVLLVANGITIDQVSYGADGGVGGESWSVDDTGTWCSGVPTAGAVNGECGASPIPDPVPTPSPTSGELTVGELVAGDLTITEIMVNPSDCSDSTGEWIELHNTSGSDIQLDGLIIEDASGNAGTIGPHLLANGQHAVLARSSAACNVTVDGVYGSSVSWNNTGDDVMVWAGITLIDSITYGSAAGTAGASWSVDGSGTWCSGPATAGGDNPICN